jgi:hypothetical protein
MGAVSVIGDSIKIEVPARPVAVKLVDVAAKETWRFDADGTWTDWFIACGPQGYRNPLTDFLDIHPRFPDASWFALVGFVGDEAFTIGAGIEHTFERSGELFVCANDLSGARWNNRGAVALTAAHLAAPSPPVPPPAPAPALPTDGILRAWIDLVGIMRKTQGFLFIAVLLVATGATLAFSQQGKDLVTGVIANRFDSGAGLRAFILMCMAALLLGLLAWFWARAVVEFRFGARDAWRQKHFLKWVPRLFGIVPFGFLLIAIWKSEGIDTKSTLIPAVVLAGLGIAFLVFVIFREMLGARLDDGVQHLRSRGHVGLAHVLRATLLSLKTVVLVAGLIAAFVCFCVVWASPVQPATLIGPAAVVLFAVALIIPPAVLAIQMGALYRIPVTPLAIALAFVFSVWNDNHAVRLVPPHAVHSRQTHTLHSRETLADAFHRWRAHATPVGSKVPIIFVAAEGGASRAAYWTGEALGALEERTHGEFSKHVFLISSISGSNLAATSFLATLKENPGLVAQGKFRKAIESYTGQDYLSPALAGMFFPDLLQRFLPWPVFPDRGKYLEEGWEAGWTKHCTDNPGLCGDPHLFEHNFLDVLSPSASRWSPVLVMSGAREEDGRRVLTSNVFISGDQVDAEDFHRLVNNSISVVDQDVRVSTAMLNGARFPFISPAGTLPGANGHLVDGGYFDTAGIETMREAANAVRALDKGASLPLKPIFLLIENGDPSDTPTKPPPPATGTRTQASTAAAKAAVTDTRAAPLSEFGQDAWGPVTGLLGSRNAHAAHMRCLLEQGTSRADDDHSKGTCGPMPGAPPLIEIRTCRDNFPLDWVLSDTVKGQMQDDMTGKTSGTSPCANKQAIEDIARLLEGQGR